jgi:hypothetical protein
MEKSWRRGLWGNLKFPQLDSFIIERIYSFINIQQFNDVLSDLKEQLTRPSSKISQLKYRSQTNWGNLKFPHSPLLHQSKGIRMGNKEKTVDHLPSEMVHIFLILPNWKKMRSILYRDHHIYCPLKIFYESSPYLCREAYGNYYQAYLKALLHTQQVNYPRIKHSYTITKYGFFNNFFLCKSIKTA